MRDQYGVLFDMYDGASPEDRKKIEDMVKIIVRHDDDIDGAWHDEKSCPAEAEQLDNTSLLIFDSRVDDSNVRNVRGIS